MKYFDQGSALLEVRILLLRQFICLYGGIGIRVRLKPEILQVRILLEIQKLVYQEVVNFQGSNLGNVYTFLPAQIVQRIEFVTTDHAMRVRVLLWVQSLYAGLYSILATVTALVRVGFRNPRSMVVRFHRRHKSQVAQIFGKTNRLERYADVIVVIGSSPVLTTFNCLFASLVELVYASDLGSGFCRFESCRRYKIINFYGAISSAGQNV